MECSPLDSLFSLFAKAIRANARRETFEATLGDGQNNLNTARTNYVYARVSLPTGVTLTEVLCARVPKVYGNQVLVAYNVENVLEVMGYSTVKSEGYLSNIPLGYTGTHAWTHTFERGTDKLFVDVRAVGGLQTIPLDTPAQAVYVTPYLYQVGSASYRYFAGGTVDLSATFPTNLNEQRPVLVGLNTSNGSTQVVTGTIDNYTGLTRFQMPYGGTNVTQMTGSANFYPSAALRLYASDVVQHYDIFLNMRQWGATRYEDRPYIHLRDVKGNGTSGGTFTAGTWQTRDLNTIVTDSHGLVALASNQATLPAGVYQVNDCRAPAFRVNRHVTRLWNATGSTQLLSGQNAFSDQSDDFAQTNAHLSGRFTLSSSSAIEIQHFAQSTHSLQGFGVEGSIGVPEIYTELIVERIGL